MLSIKNRGNAAEAVDYYVHLEADAHDAKRDGLEDYYASEGAGRWLQTAAALELGLDGPVAGADFSAVAEGRAPSSGDALVSNAGPGHRSGWDLTFSAPKSVSVVWGLANADTRTAIEQAQARAVDAAMRRAAELIEIRYDKHAGNNEPAGDGLLASAFSHGTSRAGDPDLHDHVFVSNVAKCPDGKYRSVDPRRVYAAQKEVGATYRAELARELRQVGLGIERDRHYFKVLGVDPDLERQFSKRRADIEAALQKHGASGAKASEIAALDTRRAKEVHDPAELLAGWREEAAELGIDAESIAALRSTEPTQPEASPEDFLTYMTEHEAVFDRAKIRESAAVYGQWAGWGLQEIEAAAEAAMSSPELVRLTREDEKGEIVEAWSTREMVALERRILDTAKAGQNSAAFHVPTKAVDAALKEFAQASGFALSDEQAAAVRYITSGRGSVQAVVGDAGTGKSTMAAAARMAWESAGFKAIGCALSGKAAAGLQAGSGIESSTIHRLLLDLEPWTDDDGNEHAPKRTLDTRSIIVIDEAGMVDSRIMARLTDHAERAGAKIVAIGDNKQLQAVAAGGTFRNHVEQIGAARLSDTRRQKDATMREAVEQFSRGDAAEALQKFINKDALHVATDGDAAIAQAVDRWAELTESAGIDQVLTLANTRAEVGALNEAARARMRADGRLGEDYTIRRRSAQGKSLGRLDIAEGDRIIFKKNNKNLGGVGVKNGELASIVKVQFSRSGEVEITARIDGDNPREVTFSADEYSQIEHGYAVTTHAAQGVTVDHAVVLAGGSMTSRESTYVQMSRMRYSTDIICTKGQIDRAAEVTAPTEAMADYAQGLATAQGVELEPETLESFAECRRWLNEHSPQAIGQEAGQSRELAELKELVEAMGRSRQKETTLDYEVMETEPELQPVPVEAEATPEEQAQPEPEKPEPAPKRERGRQLERELVPDWMDL